MLPLSPNTAQKRKTAVFRVKLHFAWRKTATFFVWKPCSDKVVSHSLALTYLSVRKSLVGDIPLIVHFVPNWTTRWLGRGNIALEIRRMPYLYRN